MPSSYLFRMANQGSLKCGAEMQANGTPGGSVTSIKRSRSLWDCMRTCKTLLFITVLESLISVLQSEFL